MIIEVITFASGFAAGIVLDRNVRISASPESQRIAKRLLQTGLAQLPSADTVKGWVISAVASDRYKTAAFPPVQEVSDEVLREIETDAKMFQEFIEKFDANQSSETSASNQLTEVSDSFEKGLIEKFDANQSSETSVLGSK